LIVELGLYMLLRFQKAAARGNYETGNQSLFNTFEIFDHTASIAAYAVDQVFADIWTRPGLDRRSRSLVSMSVMIAMRQPHEFAIHMGAGLKNGLTLKEIEEVLIQALPYVGYPAIATALVAAAEVIKEHGLDIDENYTGHRGLL